MVNFIRTKSGKWDTVDQSQYLESIVFIEDTKQLWSNNVKYLNSGSNLVGFERVEFSNSSISMEPNKFYFCNEPLNELDITLIGEGVNDYFVEFICDDTCIILPSNIKWENEIVPDFTQTAIMTLKIQDDTIYLVDCRKLYYVSYSAPRRTQPNRTDAFGSNIIAVTGDKFILDGPATEIKEGAFEGNDDLISIEIPSTVKKIGSRAFSNCSNLETISYQGYLIDWNEIEISDDWKEGTAVDVKDENGDNLIDYLTFTAQQDNSSIGLAKLSTNQALEYSRDGSNWSNMNTSTNISLNNGDKVYVRGVLSSNNNTSDYTQFKMSGKISASGNCNAVWDYQDLNAPLKEYCGYYMFNNCSSLVTAPELPAIELARHCYNAMFNNCTHLTTAPELPATMLAYACYYNMFTNCTSLTTTPELLATTLAPYCYSSIFYGCTSLTTAPELHATTLAPYCYHSMFNGCRSLTVAPELPATEMTEGCYRNMFYNCTSLTTAPELPATTLAEECYGYMFNGCSSLTQAPELPATTLAEWCYYEMFSECTSLTTAPELSATTLVEGCYWNMFGDCSSLNYIKCLATDISAYSCTTNWVWRVSSTGIFIKNPNMTSWSTGVNGIPTGWTIEYDSLYKTVDLDLPSGKLWSDRNIGATSPEDNGLYFQWGDTTGYSSNQVGVDKIFDWNTYKWCEGNYNTLTKYNSNSSYGVVDNKTVLDLEDDAAYVNMGSEWKMPTLEDNKELIDNTDQIFEDVNGNRYWSSTNIGDNIDGLPILSKDSIADVELNGVYFLSRTNGNSIFLPASGYCNGANLIKTDLCGRYWSSNICENNLVYPLYFGGINLYPDDYCNRSFGFCIRAIKS